jgi:hypothetical protein
MVARLFDALRRYLLLKGKLLDSLPPSARKGFEARSIMAASGKLQAYPDTPSLSRRSSRLTRNLPATHSRHVERSRALSVGGRRRQRRIRGLFIRA